MSWPPTERRFFHQHTGLACRTVRALRPGLPEAEKAAPKLDHGFRHHRAAASLAIHRRFPPVDRPNDLPTSYRTNQEQSWVCLQPARRVRQRGFGGRLWLASREDDQGGARTVQRPTISHNTDVGNKSGSRKYPLPRLVPTQPGSTGRSVLTLTLRRVTTSSPF